MRFAIDVAFWTSTASSCASCPCSRTARPTDAHARTSVIEAEAGSFARWGLAPGDELEVQRVSRRSGPGALVLVGTPIGNLGDLSPRAAEALRSADAICCEDTRRTGACCSWRASRAAQLHRRQRAHRGRRLAAVLARLARGERVAVVTDAGMPGISDPGERLVRAALRAGIAVEVVPGPVGRGRRAGPQRPADRSLRVRGVPAAEGSGPRGAARRRSRPSTAPLVLYEARTAWRGRSHDLAAALGRRPPRRRGSRAHQAARGGVAGHPRRRGGLGRRGGTRAARS